MKSILFHCHLAGVLAASALLAQSAAAQRQPTHYTVTDLGLVGPSAGPLVVTNNGLIATSVAVSKGWDAAISFQGMTQIDLGGFGGPVSSAYGVNERGQAAGGAQTVDVDKSDFCGTGPDSSNKLYVCQAFVWQNGVMSPLPSLKDASGVAGKNSVAKGINILGQAGGVAEYGTTDDNLPPPPGSTTPTPCPSSEHQFKPVIWTNGAIQQLPTSGNDSNGNPFNDPDGVVFRINDRGQAVGATGNCAAFTFSNLHGLHATLWQNGSVIDLGNLGGIAAPPPSTGLATVGNMAYYVNRSGHVVGTSGTSDGSFHAFFWSPETLIQDVGTVQDDPDSVGLAINDLGDIGGGSFPAGSLLDQPTAAPRAFIRPDGGKPLDLNSLVPPNADFQLITVCSINSRGELIGLALDSEFNLHGYLATPSDGAEDPSAELSAAIKSARFGYAWGLARQRMGWALGRQR
jgi:probable HAF family extracellular repeat protein